MNALNIRELRKFQKKYYSGGSVLDVGSMCVNGRITGRDLWPVETDYTGADIEPGRNVDVVITPENFSLPRRYDVVTCMSCLEHVARPWVTFPCIADHINPGGYLFFTAPFAFHYHRYPIDAWRYTPDSLAILCGDAGLTILSAKLVNSWPWHAMTATWVFWNLWQQFYKGIRHIECACIAQKPFKIRISNHACVPKESESRSAKGCSVSS